MRIPKYWAKGSAEDADSRGRKVAFSCWRWSDESEEHAQRTALAAARQLVQNWLNGVALDKYDYGAVPLREEVIEQVSDTDGELLGAVTRNAYGVLVLNTSRAMFVDIDFPPVTAGEGLRHFFARLFGRPLAAPEAQRERQAQDDLRRFLADRPGWAMRVYRTLAGLRVLVTQELFDPASDQTLALLHHLGCDPLYVRLCKAQQCFRARLTPKPWRCGHWANRLKYPFEDEDCARRFAQWNAEYAARQKGYATCRYLGSLGGGRVEPQVERIIELHDYATRCNERLPLA